MVRTQITQMTLEDLLQMQGSPAQAAKKLSEIREKGVENLTPDDVKKIQQELAQAMVKSLQEHPFYSRLFANLGMTPHNVTPDSLSQLAFPVRDLKRGNAINLRRQPTYKGGAVFRSSGTTGEPKVIYYDEPTIVLLREANALGWEASSGQSIGVPTLFMMPPESVYGMPFSGLVCDAVVAKGGKAYFGPNFIRRPNIYTDPIFGVPTAEISFKDNIDKSSKQGVISFNLETKLTGQQGVIMGLLPAISAFVYNVKDKRGIAGLFAKPNPSIVAYGGGLKGQGIPIPDELRKSQDKQKIREYVKQFFKTEIVPFGYSLDYLMRLYDVSLDDNQTSKQIAQAELDAILSVYHVKRIEDSIGARCLNVFAGAEIQPCFFTTGTLGELYGEYTNPDNEGKARRDIYVEFPGVKVWLVDPSRGEEIPRTEIGTPGILKTWNPYSTTLLVLETEDMFTWENIPQNARFNPKYANGTGLMFYARQPGGSGTYCG